jgi:autotransporter translocation and assembly factor TamB
LEIDVTRIRRILRIGAFVLLTSLAILIVALAATQTRWFKDWLQRYVAREAARYLNGELLISRLDGNLFGGVQLQKIQLVQGGKTVISADRIQVDYSLLNVIAHGLVIDEISIVRPVVRLRRDSQGWNVSRLVKEQAAEADREGPGRPLQITDIGIADGLVEIDDRTAATAQARLPRRVADLDFKGAFSYQPVNFTLEVGHLSFHGEEPALALNSLSGVVSVRGDDVYFENVAVRTANSSVQLKGLVRNYLGTPDANLRLTSDRLTLREFAAVVPQLEGVDLHPAFELSVAGPMTTLRTDFDVRSEAGSLEGKVTADVMAPGQSVRGELRVSNFDASRTAPRLPATRVNGNATFDLALNDDQTVRGTTRVRLENTVAAGYLVDRLDANVRMDGDRASVDASARAYGARATAKGDTLLPIAGRTALSYDLSGRADHVRADRLPRSLGVPRIASDLSASYRARGAADRLTADATFDPSTVEGVVVGGGTRVHIEMAGRRLAYSARGAVDHVNPRRLGDALGIAALRDERLDGALDASFTIDGSGRTADTLDVKADITVGNASFPIGRFSGVRVNATTARGALNARVNGRFAGVNPGAATGRPNLDGSVSGMVDATLSLPSMSSPSLETASGQVVLALDPSRMAGQDVRRGQLDARLSNGIVDVRQLALESGATMAEASGPVALGTSGESNLTYKVAAGNLAEVGKLGGVPDVAGAAVVEGTVSGNRDRLRTRGTLTLTNARYGTTAQALATRTEFDVAVPSLEISQIDGIANTTATLVKAGGREIRDLTLNVRYANQAVTFNADVNEAERRLEARGVANLGTPGTIDLQLERLALAAPKMAWTTPDGAVARIVYTPERLTVRDLRLSNGPQQIAASGVVDVKDVSGAAPNAATPAPTAGAAATALTLTAQNVDLSQLDDLIAGDRGLAGKLDGKATFAGAMANPVADVDVTIAQGAAGNFKYERLTGRAHHDASGAKVDVRLDQSAAASMTAEASLPNMQILRDETARRNAPITARIVTNNLDLGLVQMVTTAVKEVTGTAHADLRAAGTIGAPQLSGELTVQNGAFVVNATETRLQGLDAAIRLHDDQIEIEKLKVLDENHHPLSATGTVAFAERRIGKVDVKVDAQDFKIMRSRLGELSIDVKGGVAGALPAVNVRADVYVRAGRIEVDRVLELFSESAYATESAPIDVSTAPVEPGTGPSTPPPVQPGTGPSTPAPVQPAGAAAPAPATPSLFDAATFDAHLHVPNNLVLRGDDVRATAGGYSVGDLNLTVGGDIRATKAAGDRPVVVGSIKTVRGFYEFQGRRFELERDGTVSFKGPDPTDPMLDITGIREISGIEARVRVHGTAKRPRLELKSVPPLDEADVLSLIVFNRPVNELGEGERTAVGETAATMVGGIVAAPLAEALRDVLDVDMLEISVAGESGRGPTVAVGNQLGERVFVRFRQQFGSAAVTEFLIDYELTEQLRLQTSTAEAASTTTTPGYRVEQAGVDLVFVKKY